MMQSIIPFFIGMLFIAAIVYVTLKAILKYRDAHHTYSGKNDAEAQKLYAASRKKESVFMSIKDKLELSWQFLYDITNIVLNKFSKTDREATLAMGHIILDNGGRYEHVVDYGIRQEASSRDPNKSKEQVR
jgi:hypothetical protein